MNDTKLLDENRMKFQQIVASTCIRTADMNLQSLEMLSAHAHNYLMIHYSHASKLANQVNIECSLQSAMAKRDAQELRIKRAEEQKRSTEAALQEIQFNEHRNPERLKSAVDFFSQSRPLPQRSYNSKGTPTSPFKRYY